MPRWALQRFYGASAAVRPHGGSSWSPWRQRARAEARLTCLVTSSRADDVNDVLAICINLEVKDR